MTTYGPIALLGGREHREVVAPVDRWLLDHVGAEAPRVAVVPAASGHRMVGPTAALARNYWSELGARPVIVVPGTQPHAETMAIIDAADIIVLTGGVPDRVIANLAASPLWDRILGRWRSGAALSGSSAGAMALFAWRLRLTPPRPFALVPGLGPLRGYVAVPHFDRYVGERPRRRARVERLVARYGDVGFLGIDEGTGLVGWDGRYSVLGTGGVTVLDGTGWHRHPSGSSAQLRLLPRPARGLRPVTPAAGVAA